MTEYKYAEEHFSPYLECGSWVSAYVHDPYDDRAYVDINGGWKSFYDYWDVHHIYCSVGYVDDNGDEHRLDYVIGADAPWSGDATFLSLTDYFMRGHADRHIPIWCYMKVDILDAWRTVQAEVTVTIPAKTKYTITYNANGGSGAPAAQDKWQGETQVLRTGVPTREGYTFQKWNTRADGKGTNYASGASYTANASVTLYAVWKQNAITITYNANGGSNAPAAQPINIGTQGTIASKGSMSRTGYTFQKWNTKADGTGTSYSQGASFTPTSSTKSFTLYAIWALTTYAVSYNGNGATSGSVPSQSKKHGVSLTLSSGGFVRTNYILSGWGTSSTGSVAYKLGATYTGNAPLSLYAIWTLDYKKPTLSSLKCYRVNASHAKSDEGTVCAVEFKYTLYKGASSQYSNSLYRLKVEYKRSTSTTWSSSINTTSVSSYAEGSVNVVYLSQTFSTEYQYDIRVSVQDSRGNTLTTATASTTTGQPSALTAAFYTMDFLAGGKGVAIGAPSSEPGFKVAMDTTITKSLTTNGNIKIDSDAPYYFAKNANADNTAASESSTRNVYINAHDKNDLSFGLIHISRRTNGTSRFDIAARNKATGTEVDNYLRLEVDNAGSASVAFSHRNAWLAALYGNVAVIPVNADLNDYTTPGVYCIAGDRTIANLPPFGWPSNDSFLFVYSIDGTNVIQIVKNRYGRETWERGCYTSATVWTAWLCQSFNTSTSSVTWTSPWTGTANVVRNGKVVTVDLNAVHCTEAHTMGTSSSTANPILTLTSVYRPSDNVFGVIRSSGGIVANICVNTSGVVYFCWPSSTTAPTSGGFYGSITYVI